nr:hypothetical protein [Tanacetum cinerariifolium]
MDDATQILKEEKHSNLVRSLAAAAKAHKRKLEQAENVYKARNFVKKVENSHIVSFTDPIGLPFHSHNC